MNVETAPPAKYYYFAFYGLQLSHIHMNVETAGLLN